MPKQQTLDDTFVEGTDRVSASAVPAAPRRRRNPMTNQPSDETFFDQMAQRLSHWLPDAWQPAVEVAVVEMSAEERDRLVALARRAPALTWQPMETAPKDGTAFIGVFTGRIHPRVMRIGTWFGTHFGWDGTESELLAWMPLPEFPSMPPAPDKGLAPRRGTCATCSFWDGRSERVPLAGRHRCLANDGVSEELFAEDDVMWTASTFFCKLHSPLPAPPEARP
jgi:hypothetical protein